MKEFLNNLKTNWKFVKDQKWKFIKYLIFNIITIVIGIVVPILSAKMIIALTSSLLKQLFLMALTLFFIEILRNITFYFLSYYSQIIYRETFIKIQTELGREILKIENKCIDNNSSGLFIQRMTNDTSRMADVFNILSEYLANIIRDIGIFIAIFIINKVVFVYMIIAVIILYIIDRKRVKKRNENDKIFRKKNEKISGFIGEIVRGIRDIKMLNAENSFMGKLESEVKDLNQEKYKMSTVDRNYVLIRNSINDIVDLFLIILLIYLIKNNLLLAANALVIYNYSNRVNSIVYYIGKILEQVKDYNLSANRVFSILKNDEFKKEKFGTKHLNKINGDFEFKNVDFSYANEKVLNNINFKVNANSTVAFVGKSGSGKTTIFNLLCKMYDVDSGEILIDNININKLDKDSIRGNITIINQQPYIFNMSIKDNFKLVKENVTDKEIEDACTLACLDEFIDSLPDKYDTIIGEGGINLSGGQKQRMAIARALIQKTEIILFDEATSALDNETQANIQKAIDNMKKEYTILIIAHRLSTIINSDKILFLNNGIIEDEGTHDELIKKNKNYKKLYEAELKKHD